MKPTAVPPETAERRRRANDTLDRIDAAMLRILALTEPHDGDTNAPR